MLEDVEDIFIEITGREWTAAAIDFKEFEIDWNSFDLFSGIARFADALKFNPFYKIIDQFSVNKISAVSGKVSKE
jgi:hypothetical protein